MRFVDTNVLLYLISKDPDERGKAQRANEILAARDLALSAQVLQEFYVQATREGRSDRVSHKHAVSLIESFRRFPVQETTAGIVVAATATRQRFKIAYWDAAIIEAARALDCKLVLSEDLNDSQSYAGIRVENPFADC